MLRKEATNTNCLVIGLTRLSLEPTIYRTRGKHANYYATDALALMIITEFISSHNVDWERKLFEFSANQNAELTLAPNF
jgi:hypothetical protein